VRFALEQHLPATVAEVLAALTDPAFIASLAGLEKLGEPQLLDQHVDSDRVVQRVRYPFTGSLSPAVTAVVDPARLVWVEECTYDLGAATASFRILPEHYANRLRCTGRYRFEGDDGATTRFVEGDLSVSYPFVGRAVERAIVSGLESHIQEEAGLLTDWLEGSR